MAGAFEWITRSPIGLMLRPPASIWVIGAPTGTRIKAAAGSIVTLSGILSVIVIVTATTAVPTATGKGILTVVTAETGARGVVPLPGVAAIHLITGDAGVIQEVLLGAVAQHAGIMMDLQATVPRPLMLLPVGEASKSSWVECSIAFFANQNGEG